MWPFKRVSRPTAQMAAQRLVILKHVVNYTYSAPPRAMLAEIMAKWDAAERDEFERDAVRIREEMCRTLKKEGLWARLSPKERSLCGHTIVTFTERQQLDSIWRLESAQTLMWALGMVTQLPPYDTLAKTEVLQSVPTEETMGFVRGARLRNVKEIDEARDLAELWHWRSRTRELIENGEKFRPNEALKSIGVNCFEDIVRMAAHQSAKGGSLPPPIADDFPARGKAYRDLTDEEWSDVRSITMERHFALNWLCGYAPRNRWDETPTDT